MVIYGVTILSFCFFVGTLIGDILGKVLGVNSNVGGVGLAMLFLVLIVEHFMKQDKFSKLAQDGIKFWSGMYIPIVVAMAAQQNVVAAVTGGPMAILAGTVAVVASFFAVPLISKIGGNPDTNKAQKL